MCGVTEWIQRKQHLEVVLNSCSKHSHACIILVLICFLNWILSVKYLALISKKNSYLRLWNVSNTIFIQILSIDIGGRVVENYLNSKYIYIYYKKYTIIGKPTNLFSIELKI